MLRENGNWKWEQFLEHFWYNITLPSLWYILIEQLNFYSISNENTRVLVSWSTLPAYFGLVLTVNWFGIKINEKETKKRTYMKMILCYKTTCNKHKLYGISQLCCACIKNAQKWRQKTLQSNLFTTCSPVATWILATYLFEVFDLCQLRIGTIFHV